nr:hypothetical protein [Oscillospiraceae bacterium]
MNEKYEEIIDLPHHVSKVHPQMPRQDRAAQFAPYAALSGYEDAVDETARLTDRKIELDEYEKERINAALTSLLDTPPDTKVVITFFRPDARKSGGAYVTAKGEVGRIDEVSGEITLVGGRPISISDIIDLRKLEG